MKTRLILKPGQPGTKRLVEKYGDALLCVRFKYDAESRQRLKTVELIVEKTDGPLLRRGTLSTHLFPYASRSLTCRCGYKLQAKAAGGRWNPEKQLWFAKYGKIAGTPLEKHIQVDDS